MLTLVNSDLPWTWGDVALQLAGLSADDMIAVNNMRCLCGPDTKKSSGGGFTLKFDVHKVNTLGSFSTSIYM
jgi:hypothetical protein